MYRIGPSVHHREDHQSWDGLILPKDDPFWDSHFPPNGWGCKCHTRAVTEARKKLYEENGVPSAPKLDGSGGGNVPAKTQASPVKYKTYFNKRKGTVEQVPAGVDPALNWNQGKAGNKAAARKLEESKQNCAAAAKPSSSGCSGLQARACGSLAPRPLETPRQDSFPRPFRVFRGSVCFNQRCPNRG
jgi:hypothetical protein